MQFIATCGCQGAVLESNSHINRMTYFTYIHLSEQKKKQQPNGGIRTYSMTMEHMGFAGLSPQKNPKETGKQLLQFTFHIEATESRGGRGEVVTCPQWQLQILHMQYTLENEGRGGGT